MFSEVTSGLQVGSDLAIGSASVILSVSLLAVAARRRNLPFRRLVVLFWVFVFLTGTSHLLSALTVWWPVQPAVGVVTFVTAIAAWLTVAALLLSIRGFRALRSRAQLEADVTERMLELERANARLAAEADEHRRTMDSLHRTEERLRLALQAGEMGAWEWDLRDNRVEWTLGLEGMHGLAPGTFGGTLDAFVALVHEDDRPQLKQKLDVALRDRTQFLIEFRTRRRDGTEGWVSGIGRAHYEADGRPVRMVGIGLDVTTRRRAEEAARFLADASKVLGDIEDVERTLQRLAALAVPRFVDYCAVTLIDQDGSLRRVPIAGPEEGAAAAWAEFEKRSAAVVQERAGAAIRTGVTELVPTVSADSGPDSGGGAEAAEWWTGRGWRSCLTVPLKARGRTLGALTFATLGSGRQLDAADVRLAEQLAERASTAVENARLYDALRGADRRKDQFLAVLAHELRNPLSPLAAVADVLSSPGMAEPDRLKAGAVLTRQVGLLTRLIDDLLDVARISEGKFVLRPEQTTLGALVGRAIELVEPQAAIAGHTMTVDVADADAAIVVDGSRVVQALANLLANAVKFSGAGSRTWVRGGVADGVASLAVVDEGIGFAPERSERLFDMFTQEPGSDSHGGLGIGLYLVRAVAVLHGGTVTATSEGPGLGSVFTLRLPVGAGSPGALAGPQGAAAPPSPRRVLIADDNHDSVEMLALLLTMHGHEVSVAFDGEQALALAAERTHDVALLDLGMPVLDGYAVARQLAGTAARPPLVVALSGWGDADARRRTAAAGFDHHLVKPVQWAELERVLMRR